LYDLDKLLLNYYFTKLKKHNVTMIEFQALTCRSN